MHLNQEAVGADEQDSASVDHHCPHAKSPTPLTPLDQEVRLALPTEEAAPHMGRKPQTLRVWSCYQCGPIQPINVNGRLLWRVSDIRRVLEGGV